MASMLATAAQSPNQHFGEQHVQSGCGDRIITTAPGGCLVPTSFGPPLVVRPQPQANSQRSCCRPNTTALTQASRAGHWLHPGGTEFARTAFGGIENSEGAAQLPDQPRTAKKALHCTGA